MTDFSKTLIRASASGYLFVEPKAKADKDNGELSQTCKTYLINSYIKEKYGREKDITTKQMAKGIDAEDDSIKMLSIHQNKELNKNQERISNDFITGLPDIYEGNAIMGCDFIWDVKTSYDIWTFLANVPDKLNPLYYYQLQAYMWLTGCSKSAIAYCLTDMPQHLIETERKKLLYQMNVISEESPEYIEAAAGMEINLIYPDIPIQEKVLIYPVDRDDDVIEKMQQKVGKARRFLIEFEEKHLNFNKK